MRLQLCRRLYEDRHRINCYNLIVFKVTDEEFEQLVREGIDDIPEKYGKRLDNLAFVVEAVPNENQRKKLNLHAGMTLFGLYEGVPLTQRGANYNLVLPDKITIFKNPAEWVSGSLGELKEHIKHTIWHEVAHYFGLDHNEINKREK